MTFEFKNLPYGYNDLEPYIDAKTMELHYSKHHKGYFDKFVKAIEGSELENQSLESIFSNVSKHAPAVRNNGGGYYNHNIFWNCLSKEKNQSPSGNLLEAINKKFGDLTTFKQKFSETATLHFGSGFAWLVLDSDKELQITSTPNQDNPLMDVSSVQGTPIFCLDVWEHAYYLKYQNKRPDYIQAFWNVVNWKWVDHQYNQLNR